MSILFVGTSHVSSESIAQIRGAINSFSPNIVCAELDRGRLAALINKQKPHYPLNLVFKLGVGGYLFALVASTVQRKLGNLVGTTPGEDMLTAVKYAREKKISVALIDQPIEKTMQRISESFGARVIFAMIKDFFSSLLFPKRTRQRLGLDNFSLNRAPSEKFVRAALQHLESNYPSLYSALLVERNTYMVDRIMRIVNPNPESRVLVVVGAAHVPGMQEELRKRYKVTSERLFV